jgi:hypothetical protein
MAGMGGGDDDDSGDWNRDRGRGRGVVSQPPGQRAGETAQERADREAWELARVRCVCARARAWTSMPFGGLALWWDWCA